MAWLSPETCRAISRRPLRALLNPRVGAPQPPGAGTAKAPAHEERGPSTLGPTGSAVAAAEVIRAEAVEVDERQVGLGEHRLVPEDAVRVALGLRLLGGLDPDVAVLGEARTGRDELSDDDVLLERSEERRVGKEWRFRWSPYH